MDAYQVLFDKLNLTPEQFLNIGFNSMLPINDNDYCEQWECRKSSIFNRDKQIIRSYGRSAENADLYKAFYKRLLDIDIDFDKSNNGCPSQLLNKYTNYRKNTISENSRFTRICNYQVSHVFGRTKNPFLFTALWNIAYIPKYLDPFTGHESKGEIAEKIRSEFQKKMIEKREKYILDYNKIYEEKLSGKIDCAFIFVENKFPNLNKQSMEKFQKDARNELKVIE